MNSRQKELEQYLTTIFESFEIIATIDDASLRKYFRIKVKSPKQDESYIVMDCPPKYSTLDDFIFIDDLFRKALVNAPKIYHQNKKLGFLVLQDFGTTTLLLKNNLDLYKLAIEELLKIQNLTTNNIPVYNKQILLNEMNLCKEWFNSDFEYEDIFAFVLENINQHKKVVVHRDYHSRNIMVYQYNNKDKLGVIDFQDCIYGSYVYDLASLLKDAYIELNQDDIATLQKYYFTNAKLTNFAQFITDFEMIATQRHLKILGIFQRLHLRDNKHNYLQNLPLVKKYLIQIADKYPELTKLKELCKR